MPNVLTKHTLKIHWAARLRFLHTHTHAHSLLFQCNWCICQWRNAYISLHHKLLLYIFFSFRFIFIVLYLLYCIFCIQIATQIYIYIYIYLCVCECEYECFKPYLFDRWDAECTLNPSKLYAIHEHRYEFSFFLILFL